MSSLDDTKTIQTDTNPKQMAKDFHQVVCFGLDNLEFGLEVSCVEEIIRPRDIDRAADQTTSADRKTSWRGRELTVIDLRNRLGCRGREFGADTRIIIISMDGRYYGAVVDSVSELLRLDPAQMECVVDSEAGVATEFIKGMYRDDDRRIIILDGGRVFDL